MLPNIWMFCNFLKFIGRIYAIKHDPSVECAQFSFYNLPHQLDNAIGYHETRYVQEELPLY